MIAVGMCIHLDYDRWSSKEERARALQALEVEPRSNPINVGNEAPGGSLLVQADRLCELRCLVLTLKTDTVITLN